DDGDGRRHLVAADIVVNAAGLDADRVAAAAGLDIDARGYRLRYVKGHYFRVHPRKRHLARHLIYPIPPRDLGGLGIHVTLELDGALRLGPDIQPIPRDRPLDYHVPDELRAPFYAAVGRYLDGLAPDDLSPDQAGVRTKAQAAAGAVADFIIN